MEVQIKKAKILFFVDGPAPTPEDFKASQELNGDVMFRNARAVPSEQHSLEICDGVTGSPLRDAEGEIVEGETIVPQLYAERFPDASEAIAKKAEQLEALASKVGDTKAPKSSKKKAAGWTANT